MSGLTRRGVLQALLPLCAGSRALAQDTSFSQWPTRVVRTVLPSGPGGGSDVVLRLVDTRLQESWHQPVIVDYRPGANSILATDLVAKSPADGYTLGMALSAFTINPGLYPSLPYDQRDLIGISQIASADFGLFATPSLEVNTIAELIAYAKRNPGKLSYATSGVGSGSHLAWELFNIMAGTSMVHIPYSKGGGSAQMDLVSGRLPLVMDVAFGWMNLVQQGKLKVIAFASPKRSTLYPEVPLIAETLPGFSTLSSMGIIAPSALAPDLVQRISADVVAAVRSPETRARFAELGLEPVGSSSGEYNRFLRSDTEKWTQVIKKAGIKLN